MQREMREVADRTMALNIRRWHMLHIIYAHILLGKAMQMTLVLIPWFKMYNFSVPQIPDSLFSLDDQI